MFLGLHSYLLSSVCFSPDGGGDGGGDPAPQPQPKQADPAPQPQPKQADPARQPAPRVETFSADYVDELRAENAKWRTKAREKDEAVTASERREREAHEAASARVAAREAELTSQFQARQVSAELKLEAVRLGIKNVEDLQLVKRDEIKIDDKGDVIGAAEAVQKLLQDRPYLFEPSGANPSRDTGRGGGAPPPARDQNKDARSADPKDYQAMKNAMLAGARGGASR